MVQQSIRHLKNGNSLVTFAEGACVFYVTCFVYVRFHFLVSGHSARRHVSIHS